MQRARPGRRLIAAGWLFAAGSTVHIVDHLRRGQGSVSDELYWLGNAALVAQVVVVTLVLTRHPRAPHAAAAAGFPLALGFFAAHWLPWWSALSDPVWEVSSLRWFSYAASTAEIVGALAVGTAGLLVLRGGMPRNAQGGGAADTGVRLPSILPAAATESSGS